MNLRTKHSTDAHSQRNKGKTGRNQSSVSQSLVDKKIHKFFQVFNVVASVVFLIAFYETGWWETKYWPAVNVITFLVYGVDKVQAKMDWWRRSEDSLLMLGLIGGWIGAVFAQQLFRHKISIDKREFQLIFFLYTVTNIILICLVQFYDLRFPHENFDSMINKF